MSVRNSGIRFTGQVMPFFVGALSSLAPVTTKVHKSRYFFPWYSQMRARGFWVLIFSRTRVSTVSMVCSFALRAFVKDVKGTSLWGVSRARVRR